MKKQNLSKFNFTMLIIISFFRFCGDSYFYGFLGRYLKTLPINDTRLGLLLSLIPFMAVIGNLVISKIGTTMKRDKIIIGVWTAMEVSFVMASGFCTEFWFVVLFDVMCNFCSNSFYNMFDTFILPITQKANKTYSFGRIWGTLAYIIGTFTGGLIIEHISYKYTFLIAGSMMLMAGVLFYFLKFSDFENDEEDKKEEKNPPKYKELFKIKNFPIYMCATALLIGCNWASDNAYILYTDYLEMSPSLYGYSFGIAIIMEAVSLFAFSKVRSKFTLKKLMIVAGIATILKDCIMAIPNLNIFVYFATEGLRGVTYGLILTCNLNLIEHILGKRLMRKGFFITIAIDEMISALLDFFMPSVISITGYTPVFLILAGFMSVAVILFFFIKIDPLSFDEKKAQSLKTEKVVAA